MEIYLLKSAACLAILLLFYKLLLEKEKMHRFKRFYLLASVALSIVIPWITFTTYVEVTPVTFVYEQSSIPNIQKEENGIKFLLFILWSIYGLGVLFFSIKFLKNLSELILKIKHNPKLKSNQVTNVLLQEEVPPHTFWNYIFLNKQKFETHSIPQEVFEHEEAHAAQKHSFDILFMELLQIVFWFNPLFYLAKNAIKLNHEFLADAAVLQKGVNTAIYQETLLSFSSHQLNSSLSNYINYSSTRLTVFGKTFSLGKFGQVKKRFTVMKTKTSKKGIFARTLLTLPLLAILLYSFSTMEVVQQEISQENGKIDKQEASETITQLPNGEILSVISSEEPLQEIATPEMIAKYNKMAAKYPPESWPALIQIQEYKEMQKIYKLMTPEQKRQAKPFPELEIIEIVEDPVKEVTPQMIAEYNKLAKFYNTYGVTKETIDKKGNEKMLKEFSRIIYIYKLMTPQQRKTAEKLPPPPPPSPIEVVEQMPAPPPPPPSPEEAVKKWINEGAIFYYNGKEVLGKTALELVQKNGGKKLSVKVEEINSEKIVKLSDSDKPHQ